MRIITESENNGWIRLWRKLLSKRIWRETDPKEKAILITLLLIAEYNQQLILWKNKEIQLKPGSMVISCEDVAYLAGIGISVDDIDPILAKFESVFDFLKIKFDRKNNLNKRLIKILNWSQYQVEGLTAEESQQRRDDAEKLYKFYLEKIQPFHKTKGRAISNILKWTKKYTCKDLAKSVLNYKGKALNYSPEHRKDPANFFGVNEPYFKDFLPIEFENNSDLKNQIKLLNNGETVILPSAVLTLEKLRELNE